MGWGFLSEQIKNRGGIGVAVSRFGAGLPHGRAVCICGGMLGEARVVTPRQWAD